MYLYTKRNWFEVIKMTSKILVAIDSSKHAEKAFQYASDLAKKVVS